MLIAGSDDSYVSLFISDNYDYTLSQPAPDIPLSTFEQIKNTVKSMLPCFDKKSKKAGKD